jgi:hypothetical protein
MDSFLEGVFQEDAFDVLLPEAKPANIVKRTIQNFIGVNKPQNLVVARKQDIKVHKINNTITVPKNGDANGN